MTRAVAGRPIEGEKTRLAAGVTRREELKGVEAVGSGSLPPLDWQTTKADEGAESLAEGLLQVKVLGGRVVMY